MTRKTMLNIWNAINLVPTANGGNATSPVTANANDSVLEQSIITALNGLTSAPGHISGLES